MNKTIITGRVTSDATFYEKENRTVINFTIANNDSSFKDQDGNWQDRPFFVECALWYNSTTEKAQKSMEITINRLKKGRNVLVDGTISAHVYMKENTPMPKMQLRVESLQIFDR